MLKLFRVTVQVEELVNNDFKCIISLKKTTNNEAGVLNIVADLHGQISDFIDELLESS